ncbi:MAG TPA: hypothetical protein VIF57_21025 [Polyangia bacterium]|jgi:hypothetical protein
MGRRRRFRQHGIAISLAAALSVAPVAPAAASGQGQSSSGSSNSSDSSKGSGDSSNSSNDSSKSSNNSSKNSNDSSKDSNNSTQNSPKNSSDWTTQHSSDWTTHDQGAHVLSIALLVVVVGATVLGVVLTDHSHRGPPPTVALAGFMRRQHALLLHDVSTADGPVLDAWAHDLRLTGAERGRLRRALEGSAEQGALLDALDGPIDERHAERFSAAFLRVTDRALGKNRTRALVARAVAASGGG